MSTGKDAKAIIDEVLGVDPRGDHPSVKRSGKWPKVMKAYMAEHPACEVCGHTDKINVHHIKPYHLFPESELDSGNLISVCVEPHDCHLLWAHLGDFKAWNPTIRADAEIFRFKRATAKAVLKLIHRKATP